MFKWTLYFFGLYLAMLFVGVWSGMRAPQDFASFVTLTQIGGFVMGTLDSLKQQLSSPQQATGSKRTQ